MKRSKSGDKKMYLKILFFLMLVIPVAVLGENYSMLSYGEAGKYDQEFKNRRTASGEIFNSAEFTAAHRKFPFGTLIKVTNLENNLSVTVRINDRGPLEKSRLVDLSKIAAEKIGFNAKSSIKVEIRVISIGNGKKIRYTKIEGRAVQPQDSNLNPKTQVQEFKDIFPNIKVPNSQNSRDFVIQVGAFKTVKNANDLKSNLAGQGFSAFIKNRNGYWRVFIGSFSSRSGAISSLSRLKSDIPDAFIKRL